MKAMHLIALRNAWICPEPGAMPVRQMLVGDSFRVEAEEDGWVRGNAQKDGYFGFVARADLESDPGGADAMQYRVAVRSTWAYDAADLKSKPIVDLHMTSVLCAVAAHGDWLEFQYGTGTAFVPLSHCSRDAALSTSPWAAARAFLGTPYLWAGNTGFGLDCSGLVQAAMRACGKDCPADSHQQETSVDGQLLDAGAPHQPGDLIFWKGHVAMVTNPETLIHATAHHMSVLEEPISETIARIAASDSGPVTSRVRPS